jgi:thioredoxin-related protein
LGEYLNNHYIAVKVQMDKTEHDNEYVRVWHEQASKLSNQYNIAAFPTFVVLSPEGDLIAKHVGAVGAKELLLWTKSVASKEIDK